MTEIKSATSVDPPQSGPPKFCTFKPLELDESIFWNGSISKIN